MSWLRRAGGLNCGGNPGFQRFDLPRGTASPCKLEYDYCMSDFPRLSAFFFFPPIWTMRVLLTPNFRMSGCPAGATPKQPRGQKTFRNPTRFCSILLILTIYTCNKSDISWKSCAFANCVYNMLVVQGVILACPQSVGFIVCALASSAAHACMFVCRVFKSEMWQRCV